MASLAGVLIRRLGISKRQRISKYERYYCMNLYLDGTQTYVKEAHDSSLLRCLQWLINMLLTEIIWIKIVDENIHHQSSLSILGDEIDEKYFWQNFQALQ